MIGSLRMWALRMWAARYWPKTGTGISPVGDPAITTFVSWNVEILTMTSWNAEVLDFKSYTSS